VNGTIDDVARQLEGLIEDLAPRIVEAAAAAAELPDSTSRAAAVAFYQGRRDAFMLALALIRSLQMKGGAQ